jgi:hypothetical protein
MRSVARGQGCGIAGSGCRRSCWHRRAGGERGARGAADGGRGRATPAAGRRSRGRRRRPRGPAQRPCFGCDPAGAARALAGLCGRCGRARPRRSRAGGTAALAAHGRGGAGAAGGHSRTRERLRGSGAPASPGAPLRAASRGQGEWAAARGRGMRHAWPQTWARRGHAAAKVEAGRRCGASPDPPPAPSAAHAGCAAAAGGCRAHTQRRMRRCTSM